MSKGCSASSDDLDKGVKIFDLVGVFWCMSVDRVHSSTFWSTKNTNLSPVNIVVSTVEKSNDWISWKSEQESFEIVSFVDGTGTKSISVGLSHSPSEKTFALSKFSVMLFGSDGKLELVVLLSTTFKVSSGWYWCNSL